MLMLTILLGVPTSPDCSEGRKANGGIPWQLGNVRSPRFRTPQRLDARVLATG